MSGRRSAATESGITMILCGLTLREAAAKAGVSDSTLVRACAQDGIILSRGRPKSKKPDSTGLDEPALAIPSDALN